MDALDVGTITMTVPADHDCDRATPRRRAWSRVLGVIFSPRATYADVAAHPRVLGALAVVLVDRRRRADVAFLSTEVGKDALLDQQIRTMESFGLTVTDQMYARMERAWRRRRTPARSAPLVFFPLVCGHRRRHRVRRVQRGAGRRRHLQAGVRRRRAFGLPDRRCSSSSSRRSTTRGSRCRARPTWPSSCRFSTRHRFRRGCSGRSICSSSGGSSASRSASASSTSADGADRDTHARRVRRRSRWSSPPSDRRLSGA